MRHLIILPGNSPKNKAWGELMLAHLVSPFDSAFLLEYDHWVSGEKNINFVREEEKLQAHVASLPSDCEIVLCAKSAGSLLAFLSIYHGVVTPAKCIFFGIPFDLAADDMFKDKWEPIDTFKIPALAFHNVEDPTTSYEFTKAVLATHASHIQLITTNETDHWYGDVVSYAANIDQFLQR